MSFKEYLKTQGIDDVQYMRGYPRSLASYAEMYAELKAKEFAEYYETCISTYHDIYDENRHSPLLKTCQPGDRYYNHQLKIWAKDIDELYNQFKEQK